MCEIEARFCSVFDGLKYSEGHSSRCSVFTFHSILSAWVQVEATYRRSIYLDILSK